VRTPDGHLAPLAQSGDGPVHVLTAGEIIQESSEYSKFTYRRLALENFYKMFYSDKNAVEYLAHQQFVFEPARDGRFFVRDNSTKRCLRAYPNDLSWSSTWGRGGAPEELPADLIECTTGNSSDASPHLLWRWVPLKEPVDIPWAAKLAGQD
jgi:hypothetical protein